MSETNYGCFVYLYERVNYNGTRVDLRGAQSQASFKTLPTQPNQDWDNRFNALTTGDSTWVELYADPDFKGPVLRFGPNTTIRDLVDFSDGGKKFKNAASSIHIYAERPSKWPGASTQASHGFAMSDLRRASTNRKVRKAALGVIGKIPKAGKVLSAITSIIWPKGPSNAELWDEMHEWMADVLHGVVAEVTGQSNAKQIEGLAKLLANFVASESEADFNALYSYALTLEPYFTKPLKPENNLTYLTMFGTVALAIYRVAYLNSADIYRTPTSDTDKAHKLEHLTTAMQALREAVATGFAAARARRLEMVDLGHESKSAGLSGEFWAYDKYTDLRGPPCEYITHGAK